MTKTNKTNYANNNHDDYSKVSSIKTDGKFANTTGAQSATKQDVNYAYYSRLLQKPFDSLSELNAAEEAYYAELKAKEDKAAQKKADAKKVEDAFKALNAARKAFKEDLAQLTQEYADELNNLKKAFELGRKDIHEKLAAAEDTYSKALKEFTDAHKEGYHITLRDGDFETTISGGTTVSKSETTKEASKNTTADLFNIFDLLFKF